MPQHAAANRESAWGRVLVAIPTYNEIDSLERVVRETLTTLSGVDLLVVDDSSPDGTGELADAISAREPRVSVLHRQGKSGLGAAYLAAFDLAAKKGYDIVVEMDADGSHPVGSLPGILDLLVADPATGLVIGSRWIAGGTVVDWPRSRRALSVVGNTYARVALGFGVRDSTAGFRAYRLAALATLDVDSVNSHGYCFQIDMTRRIHEAGIAIREYPIEFKERVAGVSKMSNSIVFEAVLRVTLWALGRPRRYFRTR